MKNRLYNLINCFVIAAGVILLVLQYRSGIPEIFSKKAVYLVLLEIIVLAVHTIKFVRIYFILASEKISWKQALGQYCKTVSVGVILPFKSGDIFKAYCFGNMLDNYYLGIFYILLDRFFDTLSLISVMICVSFFTGKQLTWIFYLLMIFILSVIMLYVIAPYVCRYWKEHLLCGTATPHSLRFLSVLKHTELLLDTVTSALRGKSAILYVLSVAAWLVESIGIFFAQALISDCVDESMLFGYLSAAFGIGSSSALQDLVLITIGTLLVAYLVNQFHKKKERI